MQKIQYNGETCYILTERQKKQIDRLIKAFDDCGEDYNEKL